MKNLKITANETRLVNGKIIETKNTQFKFEFDLNGKKVELNGTFKQIRDRLKDLS
jgi:hypothetical protein